MGTCFELGKDKTAKPGEGWAPPSTCCAQDTVGLYPPLSLRLLGYGTAVTFTFSASKMQMEWQTV